MIIVCESRIVYFHRRIYNVWIFVKLIARLRDGANPRTSEARIGTPGSLFTAVSFTPICPFARKWKSFLALSRTRSNRESRSPLAGLYSIGHKCALSSAYKCGSLSIFPGFIYIMFLLLASAGGTSQIIPREKTRTKIEMRRSCERK